MSRQMSGQLLTTKFRVPPRRPNLVSRPRLIERLDEGLELGQALTLISAPAGFGKSTLAAEWARRLQARTEQKNGGQVVPAWLSLDEGDSDLVRFLTYLVTTLSQAQGTEAAVGKGALSMLKAPEAPPTEPILTSLINDVAAISHNIILFLDDFHLLDASAVPASTAVDHALTFLIEHRPPQLHLVVATRVDPNLPLARLRAVGQLNELRASDLRFASTETADFLNQMMGLDLSAEDVAALERRTEGWIAGLQLAALALQGITSVQGRNDTRRLIESFTGSHRYVLDYLVEEVLEQQSDSVQTFLLQTAILDRLTGDLCDAVRFDGGETPRSAAETAVRFVESEARGARDNGQTLLETLEHANLFVVALDDERHWYRYHHLFADLLRQRLRQTQPEILSALHIRAAQWFSRQGLHREAIKHFLAAGDFQQAAGVIKAIAIGIMQEGEHTTVMRWIDRLPETLVTKQPYMCVLHAWALQLAGHLEAAEARLVAAENAMDRRQQRQDEDDDTILGLIHSHRAYITFMTGEHDKTIAYAHQALQQLPESAELIRVQTALYLGVAYRYQGQFRSALSIYNENLSTAQNIGGKLAVLACLHVGDLHRQMAHLHRAHASYQEALLLTERDTGRPEMPYTGYAYVCIGRILRQWNELEDAQRFTVKGLALCRDWNVADILALSCIELAYVSQALGQDSQARASMDEAIEIMDSFSPWGGTYARAHRAKLDLGRGDFKAAERWAEGNQLATIGAFEFHREIEYLALTRVLMAQRRLEEATELAERIQRIAQKSGKRRTELEALILLALISATQDDVARAHTHFDKAISIAEPENFIRIFVDEGPPMARMVRELLARGIAPAYLRRLLAAFAGERSVGIVEPPRSSTPASDLLEPLSDREVEVLQLIAQGLTNREIAERLYLSLHTIKAHTRNIYGKLEVHSRTQAVARARELAIIPSA